MSRVSDGDGATASSKLGRAIRADLRHSCDRIDLRPKGGHTSGPTVTLVHGTPTLNTLYWTEDRPASFCTRMAEVAGAKEGDVIVFGHTHLPYERVVDGIYFINTGSV